MPLDDETQIGGGTGNGTGNNNGSGENNGNDGRPQPIFPPGGPLEPPKKEEDEGDDN